MEPSRRSSERRYSLTWRATFPDGSDILRANLFVATAPEFQKLVRSAERWALRAQPGRLTSLELVTWCLDTGLIEPGLSFRLRSPRVARFGMASPVIELEVRWRAQWVGKPAVHDTAALWAAPAEIWKLGDCVERWARGLHPEHLESFRFSIIEDECGVLVEDYEAGKERVARTGDDVFLVFRSNGRLESDFRHYLGFRTMEDADDFVRCGPAKEDDWIFERVSRECYERGEAGMQAAQSILTRALDHADEGGLGSES